jgi:hypothetical protein
MCLKPSLLPLLLTYYIFLVVLGFELGLILARQVLYYLRHSSALKAMFKRWFSLERKGRTCTVNFEMWTIQMDVSASAISS